MILITDKDGQKIVEVKGPKNAGINRANWNLRYGAPDIPELDRTARGRGPLVLPGQYNVTLKVGDLEMTKILIVAEDSRVDISSADRKAQHDALIDLHYLNPYVAAAAKAIDDLNKQLQNVQKTLNKVNDVPEVITEHIKAMSGDLKELKTKISGDPSLGSRGRRSSIQGVLSMLESAIGGYSEAPSSRQLQRIEEKRNELETLIERINKIIQSDIPRLNELLIANDIPHVFPVKIIKFKK